MTYQVVFDTMMEVGLLVVLSIRKCFHRPFLVRACMSCDPLSLFFRLCAWSSQDKHLERTCLKIDDCIKNAL